MTKHLHVSKDLALPPDVITETLGVLAVRGAGKTNTCRVLAEEMFDAGLPFVAIDPVGSWRGLRSSRDGKGPGLPIPIFGGKWGDVPLERGGGELVADLVVDQRLSCVLDLSTFDSEASKKVFLLDFARRLYRRNEEPLHLFLEEADDYIPQRPMRDEAQLLRAWENIVRRGRARGLGITLITQRSASINKSVLTQVQTLIAMRTTGPQDRAAIEDWLKYHAQSREILESLPKLEAGEAWVWSPTFLHKTVRTRFRLSRTFDAGATPKMGKGSKAAATLADVDLGDLSKRMAAVIERAKQDDPKTLRRRIDELEKEVARKPEPAKVSAGPVLAAHEVAVHRGHLDGLVASSKALAEGLDAFEGHVADLRRLVNVHARAVTRATETGSGALAKSLAKAPARAPVIDRDTKPPIRETNSARRETNGAGVHLGTGERAILTAAAQHRDGVTREQLTVLTGYRRSSRDTYLQRLKAAGYLQQDGEALHATDDGLAALGSDFRPLPTGAELREHWLERLPEGERRLLELLIEHYPKAVDRDRLSDATDYKRSSRDTYLQRLGARKLVVNVGRGQVIASDQLFS